MIKKVDALPVTFGGEEHRGWLPRGAAHPLATPQSPGVLNVWIERSGSGVLLCWEGPTAEWSGDRFYSALEDAENAAAKLFGIQPSDWSPAV